MLELCVDKRTQWPLLVTTADHALLDARRSTSSGLCGGRDISIGVVERERLLSRFPATQRTWIKFRGGAYTGANLFALRSPKAAAGDRIVAIGRAGPQERLARGLALGPAVLIGALLRLLTSTRPCAQMGGKLGLKVTAVRLSNPLAGVDVDKRADHALAEAILAGKA